MQTATYPGGRLRTERGMILKRDDFEGINGLAEQTLFDLVLRTLYGQADGQPIQGFFGDSFEVAHVADRTHVLRRGVGLMVGTGGVRAAEYCPVINDADFQFEVPETAAPGNDRIDRICIAPFEEVITEYRDCKQLDAAPVVTLPQSKTVMARRGHAFLRVPGVEAASPSAPAVPAGYVLVAELYVEGADAGNTVIITDQRTQLLRMAEIAPRLLDAVGPRIVGPLDWASHDSGLNVGSSGGKTYMNSLVTSAVGVHAPLDLVHGATLRRVVFQTHRVATGGTFGFSVTRIADDGTPTDLGSVAIDDTLGDTTNEISGIDHVVDLRTGRYYVQGTLINPSTGDELRVYSAAPEWDI